MPKRKRQGKKRLSEKDRLKDAKRWLSNHHQEDLTSSYSKRYGVTPAVAYDELMILGYNDELRIQSYEKEGTDWEYRVEPLSGELVVMPKDADEHEIYETHGFF